MLGNIWYCRHIDKKGEVWLFNSGIWNMEIWEMYMCTCLVNPNSIPRAINATHFDSQMMLVRLCVHHLNRNYALFTHLNKCEHDALAKISCDSCTKVYRDENIVSNQITKMDISTCSTMCKWSWFPPKSCDFGLAYLSIAISNIPSTSLQLLKNINIL